MKVPLKGFRRRLFSISVEEIRFAKRGFGGCDDDVRKHLESVSRTFVDGYHAALLDDTPGPLVARLGAVTPSLRSFAYEGVGMGLALLDFITPWRRDRLSHFLTGPGAAYTHIIYLGVGWALAQLRQRTERFLTNTDPLLGWLALDGYGFHAGYFCWPRYVRDRADPPSRLTGYGRRVFDQGLGRSLWFVKGAEAERIAATIQAFPQARRPDLWSGVGLAAAYAGGVGGDALRALRQQGGQYRPQLAQGAAFAAEARDRAGNSTAHTELACQVLCAMPVKQAAAITIETRQNLPFDGVDPPYEVWRRRTQRFYASFTRSPAPAHHNVASSRVWRPSGVPGQAALLSSGLRGAEK